MWQIPKRQLHRRFTDAELGGAEAGNDLGQTPGEVGVATVGRFEIRLELPADLGRGRKVPGADDDRLGIFGNVQLVPVLELRLEEKIPVTVRLALGGIAVAVNQLLPRLDADKLRPVTAFVLRAVEKPQFVDLRRVRLGDFVVVRNRVVVPTAPRRELVALVGAYKDDFSRRFAIRMRSAAPADRYFLSSPPSGIFHSAYHIEQNILPQNRRKGNGESRRIYREYLSKSRVGAVFWLFFYVVFSCLARREGPA